MDIQMTNKNVRRKAYFKKGAPQKTEHLPTNLSYLFTICNFQSNQGFTQGQLCP